MSFIYNYFWPSATTPSTVSIPASEVVDRNIVQQKSLEMKAGQSEHKAKKARSEAAKKLQEKGGKQAATILLKQARMHDKHAEMYRQQANTLVNQGMILESATTNAEVAQLMKHTLATGQDALKGLDVDDIAETVDDWQDLNDDTIEVGRALSRPMGFDTGEDDDQIDAELAQLMEATQLEETHDILHDMPTIPTAIRNNNGGNNNGNGNTKVKQTEVYN